MDAMGWFEIRYDSRHAIECFVDWNHFGSMGHIEILWTELINTLLNSILIKAIQIATNNELGQHPIHWAIVGGHLNIGELPTGLFCLEVQFTQGLLFQAVRVKIKPGCSLR